MDSKKHAREETAHSWTDIKDIIKDTETYLTDNGNYPCTEFWFRGHEESSYILTPSLFRYEIAKEKERKIFELYAKTLTGQYAYSWKTVFDMQHYNIPTRLLDWTMIVGNAAFFAVTENRNNPCIWLLNPYRLNHQKNEITRMVHVPGDKVYGNFEKTYLSPGLEKVNYPLAIVPTHLNPRLQRQQGRFTVHGSCTAPIEQQFPECLLKIILSEKTCKEALEEMENMGLNPFSLFPDSYGSTQFVMSRANLKPLEYDKGTASKINDRLMKQTEDDRNLLESNNPSVRSAPGFNSKGISACNIGNAYVRREKEEEELVNWLNQDTLPFLFIYGAAGIGKTNFIFYHLLNQEKPFVFISSRIFSTKLDDNTDATTTHQGRIEQCIIDHIFERIPTEHEKIVTRKMIAGGDIVLVFDGLDELARVKGEEEVDIVVQQLENYIGDSQKARVIITCRDHILKRLKGKSVLSNKNSHKIEIDLLDEEIVIDVLAHLNPNLVSELSLKKLARIPLFFEIIRLSEDNWSELTKAGENDSKLYEHWFRLIHGKVSSTTLFDEWMRKIGSIAGYMLQERSDLIDTKRHPNQKNLVESLKERPFSIFVEELDGKYSFSHQSQREFILGWCISNEIKTREFDLLTSNPSFDYEGAETYQYVNGLLDIKDDLINKLYCILNNPSVKDQEWNNLTRNIFEAIGMLMPDDDDEIAEIAVKKAIQILKNKKYKGHYISYKTKYNIVRCLERIHPSAPRLPYFAHTLKANWTTMKPDSNHIGASAVRGFQMKKQKPGVFPPLVFINNDGMTNIEKLERDVFDILMLSIESLKDPEIPEDAIFLGINCTMALIRWLPKELDLDRIEELMKHQHMSDPMKKNIFWVLYRRFDAYIPIRFRTSKVFKGIKQLKWASEEANAELRRFAM